MSRLTPFGFLFGRSLNDLVRGIRRCADDEQRQAYLQDVLTECREEVRSANIDVKSQAILKLAYLEMLGIDMSWSGFHVVEVMASSNFQQKRVGYMAASQCFRSDNELKMLVTNLLKMDLVSQKSATVGVALSGLATIVSPGLAADVSDDIMRMLSHSRPYIRKKAVLAMYNIILQYPQVLPQAIARFGDMLNEAQQDLNDSGNVSVVSALVSVICELSARAETVQDFLELTPSLYSLITMSEHNWTLIKLLKIFKQFTLHEPRLKSRLLPAVKSMMLESDACALVYESMVCIIQGRMLGSEDYELARQVVDTLEKVMASNDGNLKYLASKLLCELAQINRSFLPVDIVVELIKGQEQNRATRKHIFELANNIVNDDNLFELVQELLMQFKSTDSVEYKEDVVHAICSIAAVNNYQHVPDFEWFIQVLDDLVHVVADDVVSSRLLDIVLRVKDDGVRTAVSGLCLKWILSANEVLNKFGICCWWIVGEYTPVDALVDPLQLVDHASNIENPVVVSTLAKLMAKFAAAPSSSDEEIGALLSSIIEVLSKLSFSLEYEVQERACQFLEFLKLAKSSPEQRDALLQNGLLSLFTCSELGPIAPGSQKWLSVPPELDITTPVKVPMQTSPDIFEELSSDDEITNEHLVGATSYDEEGGYASASSPVPEESAKNEAEKQLYNLSHLSKLSLKSDAQKPVKKKVTIASDETVEPPNGHLMTQVRPKPLGGSPSPAIPTVTDPSQSLTSPASQPPSVSDLPPVKVKHKKKKKSKTKENAN